MKRVDGPIPNCGSSRSWPHKSRNSPNSCASGSYWDYDRTNDKDEARTIPIVKSTRSQRPPQQPQRPQRPERPQRPQRPRRVQRPQKSYAPSDSSYSHRFTGLYPKYSTGQYYVPEASEGTPGKCRHGDQPKPGKTYITREMTDTAGEDAREVERVVQEPADFAGSHYDEEAEDEAEDEAEEVEDEEEEGDEEDEEALDEEEEEEEDGYDEIEDESDATLPGARFRKREALFRAYQKWKQAQRHPQDQRRLRYEEERMPLGQCRTPSARQYQDFAGQEPAHVLSDEDGQPPMHMGPTNQFSPQTSPQRELPTDHYRSWPGSAGATGTDGYDPGRTVRLPGKYVGYRSRINPEANVAEAVLEQHGKENKCSCCGSEKIPAAAKRSPYLLSRQNCRFDDRLPFRERTYTGDKFAESAAMVERRRRYHPMNPNHRRIETLEGPNVLNRYREEPAEPPADPSAEQPPIEKSKRFFHTVPHGAVRLSPRYAK